MKDFLHYAARLALTFLLVFLLCSLITPVHAEVRVEAGVGSSNYVPTPDGAWYQLGAPDNKLQMHGRAFQIGLVDDVKVADVLGVALHADYVNLGHARSYCRCATDDAAYNHDTRTIAPGAPLAVFSGTGMAQGLKLAAVPYVDVQGWKLGYERGVLIYSPRFVDNVYGANGAFTQLTTPTTTKSAGVFGFFVTHGRYTLSYENYRMPINWARESVPPVWTGAHVLLLSYQL